MTSRGYLQWELVGESSDPVPASEYDVEQVAKVFSDQGAQMNDAAKLLRQISELSGWSGKAAKEFAEKAGEGYGDLDKAAEKYVDAGAALNTFATAVGTAWTETSAAVADAVEADAQRRANATSSLEGVDEPTDEQLTADEDRDKRLTAANSALTAARTRLVNAMEALDTAATTAAKDIRAASEQFKDSRMDDIKGFVKSALQVIVDVLQVLAVIIALVIIVLLIIGSGGAFLAFLIAAAFWVGVVIFALVSVQFLMGDASAGDVAWAALGLVGGGLVSKGAKGVTMALGAARTAQAARVAAQARNGLSPIVRFAQRIPLNVIRNWAAGREATAVRNAVSAFDGQLDSLASTSRMLRALGVDDIYTTTNQINALRGMNPTANMTDLLNTAARNNVYRDVGNAMQQIANLHDLGTVNEPIVRLADLGTHVSGAGR